MVSQVSRQARILLVDDRVENLIALDAILSPLDQILVPAQSGEAALEALRSDEFAVVLLDIVMPGMSLEEPGEPGPAAPEPADADGVKPAAEGR